MIDRAPHPQIQISWDRLYRSVRALLDDGSYRTGRTVVFAGSDGATAWLEFDDGERIETDLVISADGIGSAVRRTVVGKSEPALYAGYVDWHAQSPEAALPRIAAATLSERLAFCQMQGG